MSQKLVKAIQKGKVVVHNRTSGEVHVRYPLPDGTPSATFIPPNASVELAPRYTTPQMLTKSNLEELLRRGNVSIV
jgi:hypothetical protein